MIQYKTVSSWIKNQWQCLYWVCITVCQLHYLIDPKLCPTNPPPCCPVALLPCCLVIPFNFALSPSLGVDCKMFSKNITHDCIYLRIQKIYLKIYPTLWPNSHHDTTTCEFNVIFQNMNHWISQEWNVTYSWNKKILKLCLEHYIFRHYPLAYVTSKAV